jgi:hypothetical protein
MEYARGVNEDARTPVAIRITRPYTTDDEFLTRELETLTRTSIVLVGAQPRPQGVVLRFELALATGQPLVRGEGRVVAFKERVFEDAPGLTLRFTRLDSKSKALVDRAAAMRDARNRPSLPPPLPPASRPPPPALPPLPPGEPVDLDSTHAEAPQSKIRSERPLHPSTAPLPLPPIPIAASKASIRIATPPAIDLERTLAEAPTSKARTEGPTPATPDRDVLLERLRERARGLTDDRLRTILGAAKR